MQAGKKRTYKQKINQRVYKYVCTNNTNNGMRLITCKPKVNKYDVIHAEYKINAGIRCGNKDRKQCSYKIKGCVV